ncbi:MAG: sodium:proton antiporter, partial [Tepidisphaeraceae bacterium]
MKKVVAYSVLLIAGMVASQLLAGYGARPLHVLTMVALAFIMIHVGYEFEIDKSRPTHYAWDCTVALSAAVLPWVFCTLYFVVMMS